jgi:hypothetical protein
MPTVRSLRGVLVAVILAGLTVGPAAPGSAQPVGAPRAADDLRVVAVDASAAPDIVALAAVPASLLNTAIDPLAFTVTADGRPVGVSVEPLTPDQLTVALIVDTADDSAVVAQQGAAVEFVLQLDPRSPVVIASTTSGSVFGPSTDRRLALQAIRDLAPGEPRATYAAIASALDAAGDTTARRALVVVSAGQDSSGDGASLRTRLSQVAIVQWISVAPGGEPPTALADLATVTTSSNENLLPLLDVVAASLIGQYRLRFRAGSGTNVEISLSVGTESWSAPVPLPAPTEPPTGDEPTTSGAPASSVAPPAPDSTAPPSTASPSTAAAQASTTAASMGPPPPDDTATTAGDEAATSSIEDEGGSFPTLALLSVFLLLAGMGGVLFFLRDRLQPAGVRPASRPAKPPARAPTPRRARPPSPPRPVRGRKPASTKTAAKAPPAKPAKASPKKPGRKPVPANARSPKPQPPRVDGEPLATPTPRPPVPAPASGLPPPQPAVPEPVTPPLRDRPSPPNRPAPYPLVEPPASVNVATLPPVRDDAPRVGARPKGSYRPSRSPTKDVSGDVRSAGPYLQP